MSEIRARMTRSRLGVAIVLPEPLRTEVRALRRALGSPSLDTQPPHITLVPPVNVRDERLDDAMAVARSAAASIDGPLRLRLGPPATFAPLSPVVYLGVHGDDVERLRALPERLLQGPLLRAVEHEYVPHCTLHELADDELIGSAMRALHDYRCVIDVDGFDLLRQEDDRVWRTLASFAFGAPVMRGRGTIVVELRTAWPPPPDARDLLAASALLTRGAPFEPWCIEARMPGGRLLGVAVGVVDTHASLVRVDDLVVDMADRGQGIGDRLVDELLRYASLRGTTEVRLEVGTASWPERWFERRGFMVADAPPDGGHDRVVLVRPT